MPAVEHLICMPTMPAGHGTWPARCTPHPLLMAHTTQHTIQRLIRFVSHLLQGHSQTSGPSPHPFGPLHWTDPPCTCPLTPRAWVCRLPQSPTHTPHLPAGCCFLVGGTRYKTQSFSVAINKASCSLLFLAAIALVIPTAAPALYSTDNLSEQAVITLSHTTAIILILL